MAEPPQTIKEDFMSKIFTPEEITVSLRVCAEGSRPCDGCAVSGQGLDACLDLFAAAVDLIEAQAKRIAELEENKRLREEQRWIPVGERLPYPEWDAYSAQFPDEDIEVLVMIKGGKVPTALRFNDEGEFYACDDNGGATFYLVTHWKPMPKGPETE